MKLTIAILFCDKDYMYIHNLLNQIQTNVHLFYEIILIDNREEFKDIPIETGDLFIYRFGYNARQVRGRKKAVELASGDYIWFVDADDEVLEVSAELESELSKNYDIITFGHEVYCNEESPIYNTNYEEDELCKDILDGRLLDEIGFPCWNKWIKKTILNQVETHIPENTDAIASEDTLLVVGALKYGNSLLKKSCLLYRVRCDRSTCGAEHYYNADIFGNLIYGYSDTANLILTMLTDAEKRKLGYEDMMEKDCAFFIERLIACEPSIRSECIEKIKKYIALDVIISSWKNYAWSLPQWRKDSFLDIREKFQAAYPGHEDDFLCINEITHWTIDANGNRVIRSVERKENLPPCFDE